MEFPVQDIYSSILIADGLYSTTLVYPKCPCISHKVNVIITVTISGNIWWLCNCNIILTLFLSLQNKIEIKKRYKKKLGSRLCNSNTKYVWFFSSRIIFSLFWAFMSAQIVCFSVSVDNSLSFISLSFFWL